MLTRRQLLGAGVMAGVGLVLPWNVGKARAFGQTPPGLRKFIQPLPGLGPAGIPVATPDKSRFPGEDYYSMVMGEYRQQFHPDLPETKLWGYADVTAGQQPNFRYLGGVIVAKENTPVRTTFTNNLPPVHPLPVDMTLPDTAFGVNRASVHLHGGHVPWTSDGGPQAWFAPDGTGGMSFLNSGALPGQADYYYPNDQSARLMWYHDHAMDITRLNAYVGLASAYIVRDAVEEAMIQDNLIPEREIPLIIQDKSFVDGRDRDYKWGKKGDLWYPFQYEKAEQSTNGRWGYGPDTDPPAIVSNTQLPGVSVVPEFFSDTIVINGAAYPYLEVEPRAYRFRILNASQARFYNLQLYFALDTAPAEPNLRAPGPAFVQIGTEGGFLPAPVVLNDPPLQIGYDMAEDSPTPGNVNRYTLLMGPAERADLIIDFSEVAPGSQLILYNDAPAPFPGGDDVNDYTAPAPGHILFGSHISHPGVGPNTRTLMQFRVVPLVGPKDPASLNVLKHFSRFSAAFSDAVRSSVPTLNKKSVKVRDLTLNEDFDDFGRLIQRLGTVEQNEFNNQGLPTWSRSFDAPATEVVNAGETEIWRIFNLTGDTHPIHFHLVNVQVLGRAPFDVSTPEFEILTPLRDPDPNELGWKETVRMNPMEVTVVMMKFDLPKVPDAVPVSPRTGGHEYVWHCHILEHEEHDMMRPLIVKP